MSLSSDTSLTALSQETCLVFEQNSMTKTAITHNGVPIYRVVTSLHGGTTEVRKPGTDTLVARIARKEVLPDTVTFPELGGGKSVRVSKWLTRTKLADGTSAVSLTTALGVCFLTTHPIHRLALYSTDLNTIVAHWQLQSNINVAPLTLVLAPGLESSRRQILAAFIYEEQRFRMREKSGVVAAATAEVIAKHPYLASQFPNM